MANSSGIITLLIGVGAAAFALYAKLKGSPPTSGGQGTEVERSAPARRTFEASTRARAREDVQTFVLLDWRPVACGLAGSVVLSLVAFWLWKHYVDLRVSPFNGPLPIFLPLISGIVVAIMGRHGRAAKVEASRHRRWAVGSWGELMGDAHPEIRNVLARSAVISSEDLPHGWRAVVKLPPGHSVSDVPPERLDSVLNLRSGAVGIRPDPASARNLVLTVARRDPLAGVLALPVDPVDDLPLGLPTSIVQPARLGRDEDGGQIEFSLWEAGHTLVAGATWSGKSCLLNLVTAGVVSCSDAVLWVADPKRVEFAAWDQVLGRRATTAEDIRVLLADAVTEMEARYVHLEERRLKEWIPTPEEPALVVVVDEFAEIANQINAMVRLVQKGRAAGIRMVVCTQRPDTAVLGQLAGAARAQLATRICLGVTSRTDVNVILGPGMAGAGWRMDRYTPGRENAGKFMLLSPNNREPRVARAYLLSGGQVAAVVRTYEGQRPQLSTRPLLTVVEPDEPGQSVEGRILAAVARGERFEGIVRAAGASRSTVNGILRELIASGQIDKGERGEYLIPSAAPTVATNHENNGGDLGWSDFQTSDEREEGA